ncbi:heavy-metal-associated domain-containing protein [Methylorubrum rhodesianum]|uniref:Heavy-metal-associated domain-containing protein n=2 Tax=Methylorubrum rhodesianum TaxID=29427 RepID=A0ABU9Z544_9HYPH|nr:heavy-metal-associated domain-containing protein [Methylorubrum rhodesianum]
MTCGHCARTIETAVRAALPGAEATVDPAAKTVTVRGTGDVAAIHKAVAAAGYTPSTPA